MFSFNERAIRSYRSVGFVVEGRAREAIWREGRWWDEISMSILDGDWAARCDGPPAPTRGRAAPATASRATPRRPRPASIGRAASGGRCARGREQRGSGADAARADVRDADRGEGPRRRQRPRRRSPGSTRRSRRAISQRTPALMQFLADLEPALEQDDGQKLGGKSAEAARFILRAIDRELDRA